MRISNLVFVVISLLHLALVSTSLGNDRGDKKETAKTPNIIFMMADDQSWNGTSVQMHPEMENSKHPLASTPNLERLAAQSMRFSAAYAPASICSPTRMSLMNGQSPAANHWTKAAPSLKAQHNPKLMPPRSVRSIDESYFTIGEALQSAGYATAYFGKWHIKGGGPENHGFDVSDGDIGNEYAYEFNDPNPCDIFGMCDRATEFMKINKEAGKPFFVQLSWHALHAPENALRETKLKYQDKGRNPRQVGLLALAENLDTGVGRIIKAVDDLGLADNTYVIYTSDNGGGEGPDSVLAGGKGSVWEGGIRVPLIVRGPGVTADSWCHETVVGYDFYKTFCEMAQVKDIPEEAASKLEGGSIWELLKNNGKGTVKRPHEHVVFHFPHYQSDDGPHSSIIHGDFKLIRFYDPERSALFNLKEDIKEENDLATSNPGKTADLEKRLADYLVAVGGELPVANPDYDPSKPRGELRGKRFGKQGSRNKGKNRGEGKGKNRGDGKGKGKDKSKGKVQKK